MQLLYFAWVRETIGMAEETVEPPGAVRTVADLVEWLRGQSTAHDRAFSDMTRLRAAVDQKFVPLDHELGAVREVAIFPPVTGG
ncbi:molybdopterin converting factor subunit 1 [Sphingomonas sp. ST-64]|uniref:Molybdopterin converting factor subunit 1 n=1 Tax=Sphingomonas plantiphila TaxID=3163295 RepID=A0ABW8YQ96_9SPHN